MDTPHKRLEADVDKLVELRINEGLSQRELAARAGVTNTSIWKLERGGNVRPATLKKIADVLGVKPMDLLKERRS
jgi:transcriptional regulator with XRE-family HTH domain